MGMPLRKKIYIALGAIIFIIVVAFGSFVWWEFLARRVSPPIVPTTPPVSPSPVPPTTTPPFSPSPTPPTTTPPVDSPLAVSIAQRLEVPWSLDFLPDGSMIFTERPGRIRLFDARQGLVTQPLLTITDVAAVGEGGLLGIAVHPDFSANHFIYVYYTYRTSDGLANQVVRFRLEGRSLLDRKVIISSIPGASIHDGGRLKFGPDKLLYITAGDASVADRAQDLNSLSGKILRLRDDGSIPPNNPFSGSLAPGPWVYSFGHRNPEGLAWDNQGRLWATEHGSSATDELNLIEPGKNYGWPVIRGD